MNSLIDRANSTSYFGVAEKKSHWKYDWHAPARPETSSGSQGATNPDSNRTSDTEGKTSLRFKTWLRSEMPVFGGLSDIEKSDLFDLSKYSTGANGSVADRKNGQTAGAGAAGDSLTEEDIRGAVGNSGSMATLSSGAAGPGAGSAAQEVSKAPDGVAKEPSAQTDGASEEAQPTIAPKEDDGSHGGDAEGDVNME